MSKNSRKAEDNDGCAGVKIADAAVAGCELLICNPKAKPATARTATSIAIHTNTLFLLCCFIFGLDVERGREARSYDSKGCYVSNPTSSLSDCGYSSRRSRYPGRRSCP